MRNHNIARKIFITVMALFWMAGAVTFYGNTPAAGANNPNNLPYAGNANQTGVMNAMGMSTSQSQRTDPAGNVIDKNTSTPLGPSMIVENQILQLAGAGLDYNKDPYDIYNNAIVDMKTAGITIPVPNFTNPLLGTDSTSQADWYDVPKAMTAADVRGIGHDVLITAALPSTGKHTCSLELIVTDYNGGTPLTGSLVLQSSMTKPVMYDDKYQYPIKVAAGDFKHNGKDQIAIAVGNTLYFVGVAAMPANYSLVKGQQVQSLKATASILSETTFDSSSTVAQVSNTSDDWPAMDLVAADANGDNYKDLLVTTGSSNGGSDKNIPKLLIYSDTTDASQPTVSIPLQEGGSGSSGPIFKSPNVAVGNIFSAAEKDIVIAGMTTSGKTPSLTYIDYHPDTEQYDTALDGPTFSLSEPNVSSCLAGLAIASLDGPDGNPQYVVYGDQVFQYDATSEKFVNQNLKIDIGSTYHRYMVNIVTGNFDGNTTGKEQMAMLYIDHSKYHNIHKDRADLTWISVPAAGTIDQSKYDVSPDNHPAISAPDVFDNGIKLVYDRAEFTFSDPTVIAVLAASPYYSELQYPAALGSIGTSFGTGQGSESGVSNGVNASVGVSVGFEQDIDVIVKIGEVNFESELEASFTNTWSKSKSIEKSISYNNYNGAVGEAADSVVVSSTPYDIYYYKAYTAADPQGTEVSIQVPYTPETNIEPLDYYNNAVKQYHIANAPTVDDSVLGGITVGDPRTYPSNADKLSNVDSSSVLTGSSFIGAGIGNNSSQQSVETSTSTGTSFQASVNLKVSFSASLFGATAGVSAGAGYTHGTEKTTTSSTTFTGSVAGVPAANSNYQFDWELVAYDYNLTAGDSTQECVVVNYLVKPTGAAFPPVAPGGLKVASVGLTSATLQWDRVSGAAGYVLQRSSSADGSYTKVDTLLGVDKTGYTDASLQPNTTYYYEVYAYTGSPPIDGLPSSAVTAKTLQLPAPGGLKVASVTRTSATLQWDQVSDAAGYALQRSSSASGGYTTVKTLTGATATSYTDSPLQPNTSYYYEVHAYAGSPPVDGLASSAVAAKTLQIPAPGGLKVASVTRTSATLQWDQVSGAAGYALQRSSSASGGYTTVKTLTGATATSYTDSSLQPNTSYYYEVHAYAGSPPVDGLASSAVAAKTLPAPTSGLPVTLTVDFKVGSTDHAKVLVANEPLEAIASIENNRNASQKVLFITALYDSNGTMLKESSSSITIAANATGTTTDSFTLPGNVASCTVSAFVWDGGSLQSSTLTLLSNIVKIP